VRSIRQTVPIDVFKTPDAPASQLLGGGRSVVDIYIDYYKNEYLGYRTLDVYVNGTLVASCYRRVEASKELRSWTEYVQPNATGDYLFVVVGTSPSGNPVVLGADITLYGRGDGSFGFALTVNPIENATEQDLPTNTNYTIPIKCPSGSKYYAYIAKEVYDQEYNTTSYGPLAKFMNQMKNNETLKETFCNALDAMTDTEFNIPYIAVNRTSKCLVYHTYISRQSGSATLRFKTLSISSFGAVYANVILPIDIKLPPPAIELPPTVQSSQSNQPSSSNQQSLRDLLRNIPRTYIAIYKG
jgi:hypothetical protein